MAWHNRYVKTNDPISSASGLRTNVTFIRDELLWRSQKVILDPYTGEEVSFPVGEYQVGYTCYGANILDILERVREEVADGDNNLETRIYWRLRDPHAFFAPLKKRTEERYGSLLKKYCAGGTVREVRDNFVLVSKRSSVSINALVYKLAVGMMGDYATASRKIGEMAAKAWSDDLVRAEETYNAIIETGGRIEESFLPIAPATSTISQQVETAILRECCYWLDIDPDKPTKRERGQPRKHSKNESKYAGIVIELEIVEEGEELTIIGRLINPFEELEAGTLLSSLTLYRLVHLLAALKEEDALSEDAELLESYLESVDENWQEKAAAELEAENSTDDPWSILDISQAASLKDIKRHYRELMKKVHPDTSGLPSWVAQKVSEAYQQINQQLS